MGIRDRDFGFIQRLVLDRSAIVLDRDKKYLVESRLAPLLRLEKLDGFGALVEALKSCQTGLLTRKVVESMTTNETSFFRDGRPFETLKNEVLPHLIASRRMRRSLTIWCAACSSGQEPYSISMIIKEHFPELENWRVRIIGTDISGEILDRAKEGIYSQLEMNRGLSAPLLVKYFEKQGVVWRAKLKLRDSVEFRQMNLARLWSGMPLADVVFMRNVLIYFDVATKRSIVRRAGDCLCEDGFLFLGRAESTINIDDRFERAPFENSGCYRIKHGARKGDHVVSA